MGIIEDSIFSIYKKALEEGNMDQATKAVELMQNLREKVEIHGFKDHALGHVSPLIGTFFEPFPYRYSESESIVVINQSAILLTKKENKLFKLFSNNESQGSNITVVSHIQIHEHMWESETVSHNALRIAINRLRNKIEPIPEKPQILLNYYEKGYIFLGKNVGND